MIYKYYLIENSFIGFMNDEEHYINYMAAMIGLMDIVKDEGYISAYPKSKWTIVGVKPNNKFITVYSVTSNRLMT